MQTASKIIFKALLDRTEENKRQKFLDFLTEKEKKELKELPETNLKDIENVFFQEDLVDSVHYSWLIPTLKAYSKEESALFLQIG